MSQDLSAWKTAFFIGAGILVLVQAVRGWRLGVMRQAVNLLALAGAYLIAFFGGRFAVPFLRPLGFPDPVLAIIGGALMGFVFYTVLTVGAAILFKRTSQQSIGLVKLGYGGLGAVLGALFGIVLVWMLTLGVRLLGSVAETEIAATKRPARVEGNVVAASPPQAPGRVMLGLVELKQAISEGRTGAVIEHVDPLPGALYSTLSKLGRVVSSEHSVNRFLAYPGVKALAQNPKIAALQSDPAIMRSALSRDFVGLMRNERVVAAANDPEVAAMLRKFEFEKALDHALASDTRR